MTDDVMKPLRRNPNEGSMTVETDPNDADQARGKELPEFERDQPSLDPEATPGSRERRPFENADDELDDDQPPGDVEKVMPPPYKTP